MEAIITFDKCLSWLCFQSEATLTNTFTIILWEYSGMKTAPTGNSKKLMHFSIKNKLNKAFENII